MQLISNLLNGKVAQNQHHDDETRFCCIQFGRICFGRTCIVLAASFLLMCFVGQTASADEEYNKFLTRLREIGAEKNDPAYFQVAFEYLTYLESTDLVSNEIKQSLGYEKGMLLIASANFIKSKKQRDAVLDNGKNFLKQFVKENEYHPAAPAAKNTLANLLIRSARNKIKDDAGKNSKLVAEARQEFNEAGQIVIATRASLKEQLLKVPANAVDERLKKRRSELESEFLKARLMLPAIQEEISDTYPAASNARKQSLEAAAKEYLDISSDYRLKIAGKSALLLRGRVLVKLSQLKEAIALFREIFQEDDRPEFRELKRRTLVEVFPIWLSDKKSDAAGFENGFIEAVKVTEPILNSLSTQEEQTSSWLEIRLELAKAYRKYHEYLRDKKDRSPDEKIEQSRLLQNANRAARFVAQSNSNIRRDAQSLLVSWGVKTSVDSAAGNLPAPTNFVEARTQASKILSDLEIAKKQIASLREQISADPANKDQLVTELNAANQTLLEIPVKAIQMLQLAIGMSNDATPIGDINLLRYQLCYSYYILKDYTRAALIGEFLLERFPSVNGSRESAAIAMYSFWDLYQVAKDDDKVFFAKKVDGICSKIIATWPKQNESAEAIRMLISIAISAGKLDRAVALLDSVPDDSIHKTPIQLNTGYALWLNYVRQKKAAADTGKLDSERAKLVAIRDKAQSLLDSGAKSIAAKDITAQTANSILSLAKIRAEKSDGSGVLELFEADGTGLIELINSNHPSTSDPGFRLNVFRIALKGYVHSIAPNSDAGAIAAIMNKAGTAMDKLKLITAKMENGEKLMVSLYYSFANDIKSKMESITSIAAKKNFAGGLSDFLIGAANASDDLDVIMWAVGTLNGVAETFADAGEESEAEKLYKASVTIIEKVVSRKIETTEAERLSIIRNHAKALLGSGEYEKSIEKFVEFLTAKSSALDVQIDAANAYMKWGEKTNKKELIVKAIIGGGAVKDPKTKKRQRKSGAGGGFRSWFQATPNSRNSF